MVEWFSVLTPPPIETKISPAVIGAADSGMGVFRRKRSEEENPLLGLVLLLNPRIRIPIRKMGNIHTRGLGPWEPIKPLSPIFRLLTLPPQKRAEHSGYKKSQGTVPSVLPEL